VGRRGLMALYCILLRSFEGEGGLWLLVQRICE
jgi:hypothetical protein